jgi:hypothetical protein
MPTSIEVAAKYGVSERHARRLIAKHDPRVSEMIRPTRPTEKAKDRTVEDVLDEFRQAMNANPSPLHDVILARHSLRDAAERVPEGEGTVEFKRFVAETLADIEAAERLIMRCSGRLITRCRKFGWRPPSMVMLTPLDPATDESWHERCPVCSNRTQG